MPQNLDDENEGEIKVESVMFLSKLIKRREGGRVNRPRQYILGKLYN